MLLDELLFDKTPVIKIEKSPFEVTVGPEPALKEMFRSASNDRPMKEFILNANGGRIMIKVLFLSIKWVQSKKYLDEYPPALAQNVIFDAALCY